MLFGSAGDLHRDGGQQAALSGSAGGGNEHCLVRRRDGVVRTAGLGTAVLDSVSERSCCVVADHKICAFPYLPFRRNRICGLFRTSRRRGVTDLIFHGFAAAMAGLVWFSHSGGW